MAATAAALLNPAFSPLALFACTLSNAQMLVDSMELRELVAALKLVSRLHFRVVEIIEPTASRAQELAELYSRRESDWRPDVKPETKGLVEVHEASPVVAEVIEDDNEEEEEEEEETGRTPQSATGKNDAAGCLADSWKQLLRRSYRLLKAERRALFDFTKSYSAPVNLKAAEAIITKAITLSNNTRQPVDTATWRASCIRYVEQWYRKTLKPTYTKDRNRNQLLIDKKLNRRQRSYDSLAAQGALTVGEQARMQLLLSRDYTSSDEEEADGGVLVKRLAWQAEEAGRLKATIDRHFAEAIASPRERQEMLRVRRDPGRRSCRGPPADAPDWTVDLTGSPLPTGDER